MDKDKLYQIGLEFKQHNKADKDNKNPKFVGETWDSLDIKYGSVFGSGERFRDYVKKRQQREGILPSAEKYIDSNIERKLSDLDLKEIQLKKEKIKLQDQRTLLNKLIRESARKENLIDYIKENARTISKEKPLLSINPSARKTNKTGVLQLSDWHYSLVANNFLNEYNTDVFENRINRLVEKSIEYGCFYDIESLYVLLQGDFISSSIHNILRIQNQEDVISQIQRTSETIAEVLNELSSYFKIKVAIVTDNHSRVTPDKNDSLEEESYIRLTEWYLKTRLENNKSIEFLKNKCGLEIASFDVYNHKCCMVHGHYDSPKTMVQNISTFTRDIYDYIFSSHLHHPYTEEINMTTIIGNGSLCGVDAYSSTLRKSSHPSQNFSVFSKDDGLVCVCPIRLD